MSTRNESINNHDDENIRLLNTGNEINESKTYASYLNLLKKKILICKNFKCLIILFGIILALIFSVWFYKDPRATQYYLQLGQLWSNNKPTNYTTSPLRKVGNNCNDLSVTRSFFHGCCDHKQKFVNVSYAIFFDLLQTWKNLNVVFAGDSLTRQTIDSLSIYLNVFDISFHHEKLSEHVQKLYLSDYNTTIFFVWFYGIDTAPLGLNLIEQSFLISMSEFESHLHTCDVSYINFGLHHTPGLLATSKNNKKFDTEEDFYTLLRYIVSVAKNNSKQYSQHFYRLTYPQHFESEDGKMGTNYELTTKRNCVQGDKPTMEHHTSVLARKYFLEMDEEKIFKILDYNQFLNHSGDLHSLRHGDCSHWCWNSQMWNGIWDLKVKGLTTNN
jgi:hypothetical protein